ncbi:Cerato-platanin-domain-containing protein [Aspergillus karnatakaensis]|uniref:allergenic cerato-platanin Asp F13 n=1 Tax=Aspergillus karnatakaensis TaxID=1810916 RepID=UPI003CCD2998
MKITALLTLLPAALAANSGFKVVARQANSGTSTLSYDPKFDVGTSSLNTVACSDGDFGLVNEGFSTFDSLPSFPRIGGAPTVAGWGSANCGKCYEVSYTNAAGVTTSLFVTAVDSAPGGFNVGVQAMNELTGNRAIELGRVNIAWTEVSRESCGLTPRA